MQNKNLKALVDRFEMKGNELAAAAGVSGALVSHWLNGRKSLNPASDYIEKIAAYAVTLAGDDQSKRDWLSKAAASGTTRRDLNGDRELTTALMEWICLKEDETLTLSADRETAQTPDVFAAFYSASKVLHFDLKRRNFPAHGLVGRGVRYAAAAKQESLFLKGEDSIAEHLQNRILASDNEQISVVNITLSSASCKTIVFQKIRNVLNREGLVQKFKLRVLMPQNSGNILPIVSGYMTLLAEGLMELAEVENYFTASPLVNTVTIDTQKFGCMVINEPPVGEPVGVFLSDSTGMGERFDQLLANAVPLITAYGEGDTREIRNILTKELSLPGDLDILQGCINPIYMTTEAYTKVLIRLGCQDDQLTWRIEEFERLKSLLNDNLKKHVIREIIYLPRLEQILSEHGCLVSALHFLGVGVCRLTLEECRDILEGYLWYCDSYPNFNLVLAEEVKTEIKNSCWHVKHDAHVLMQSWANGEAACAAYSQNAEMHTSFQKQFEQIWTESCRNGMGRHSRTESCRNGMGRHSRNHIELGSMIDRYGAKIGPPQ